MKIKLLYLLLFVFCTVNAKVDLSFSNPDVSIVNNHTLNLLNQGKIKDDDTGYVFTVKDLNLKRIKYDTNIFEGKQTIEVYAYVRCGINYDVPYEGNDSVSNYMFIRIIYDDQGNVIHVLPVLTDRDCTNPIMPFEEPISHENKKIDFTGALNFHKPNSELLIDYVKNLIQNGKVINKNHVFSSNELSVSSIGYAVYLAKQNHIIEIKTKLNCDVVYSDYSPAQKVFYNYLDIQINPTNNMLINTNESLGKKLAIDCK